MEQYSACEVTLADDSCASVARCHGRRLVLNVGECSELFAFLANNEISEDVSLQVEIPGLQSLQWSNGLRQWVASIVPGHSTVELDDSIVGA